MSFRSTGQILHRKTVYGTVRTIYVPENSNELFVVSNPVYGQPEVHIHHYPDVALEECEVLELRIDTGTNQTQIGRLLQKTGN